MAHRWLSIVAACALLASCASAAPAPPSSVRGGIEVAGGSARADVAPYRASRALVIGIDDYTRAPKLTGAVRDARAVKSMLERHGFTVDAILENDEATGDAVRSWLGDRYPALLGPEDRVVIYFAGHGVSTGSGDSRLGYLLPVAADPREPRRAGISMRELVDWFQDYPAKHVLFVADACYSGLALSSRSAPLSPSTENYIRVVSSSRARIVMTAGGEGEQTLELRGRGLFTTFFIDAIEGKGDADHNGVVTTDEIYTFVRPRVIEAAQVELKARQTPQIGRIGEGEVVFIPGGARPWGSREGPVVVSNLPWRGAAPFPVRPGLMARRPPVDHSAEGARARGEAYEALVDRLEASHESERAELQLDLNTLWREKMEAERSEAEEAHQQAHRAWVADGRQGAEPLVGGFMALAYYSEEILRARLDAFLKEHPTHPRNDEVLFELGYIEDRSGDSGAAVDVYRRLITHYPRSAVAADAHLEIGRNHLARGDHALARVAFEAARELGDARGQLVAQYMLAWCDYHGGRLEPGIASLKTVFERSREMAADREIVRLGEEALGDLTWFFVASGDTGAAVTYFERTVGREVASRYATRMSELARDRGSGPTPTGGHTDDGTR
jgi:tetratricopeptide (TPR) repeat protein